jgi:transcriptional regulator with XRE-family HTH domain
MGAREQRLHYTACGIDNIVLLNGFTYERGGRGRVVKIKDQEGLHRAIGELLIRQKNALSGRELRYLRHEMGLSQRHLAECLGESEQSVARREKSKKRRGVPGPQERMIRYMYEQFIGGDEELRGFLSFLTELDEVGKHELEFRMDTSWQRAA